MREKGKDIFDKRDLEITEPTRCQTLLCSDRVLDLYTIRKENFKGDTVAYEVSGKKTQHLTDLCKLKKKTVTQKLPFKNVRTQEEKVEEQKSSWLVVRGSESEP